MNNAKRQTGVDPSIFEKPSVQSKRQQRQANKKPKKEDATCSPTTVTHDPKAFAEGLVSDAKNLSKLPTDVETSCKQLIDKMLESARKDSCKQKREHFAKLLMEILDHEVKANAITVGKLRGQIKAIEDEVTKALRSADESNEDRPFDVLITKYKRIKRRAEEGAHAGTMVNGG